MAISTGWRIYQLRALSFFGDGNQEAIFVPAKNLPVFIKIDSVKVNLPVIESSIVNGVWQIPSEGAGHLSSSSDIGLGNMVIYAHNKNSLFGPIRWIKKDSLIEIIGQDGKPYHYQVTETRVVNPDRIEYVLPKAEEILTLYTCTGLFDSKRFIVLAKKI